jgi:hypothetical protein
MTMLYISIFIGDIIGLSCAHGHFGGGAAARLRLGEAHIANMDGVARALVFGKLCYPRTDWRVVPSVKPNHRSWEQPEVKAAPSEVEAAILLPVRLRGLRFHRQVR